MAKSPGFFERAAERIRQGMRRGARGHDPGPTFGAGRDDGNLWISEGGRAEDVEHGRERSAADVERSRAPRGQTVEGTRERGAEFEGERGERR